MTLARCSKKQRSVANETLANLAVESAGIEAKTGKRSAASCLRAGRSVGRHMVWSVGLHSTQQRFSFWQDNRCFRSRQQPVSCSR